MIDKDNEMMELKGRCVPLIIDCPRRDVREGCPFSRIRKSDVVSRVNWIKSKTGQELRSLLKHHIDCLSRTEERVSK